MNAEQVDFYNEALSIQVSINAEQSRLVSPRTPAIEKVQALRNSDDFFNISANRHDREVVNEPLVGSDDLNDEELRRQVHESSWYGVDHRSHQPGRFSDARVTLRDALSTRKRSSSGPERAIENIQKAILAIPKKFSLSQQSTEASRPTAQDTTQLHPRVDEGGIERHADHNDLARDARTDPRLVREDSDDTAIGVPTRPHIERLKSAQSSLRRSHSDESLALSRILSHTSSLGDDSRFEHIQNQVNSRMKAIRDSWQDTSIKLPSFSALKTDIFGDRKTDERTDTKSSTLASLKPDFLRNHGHSHSIDSTIKPVDPLTRQPFQSYMEAHEDLKHSGYSCLDQALVDLEGDVIVLGGYRGSVLRSTKPPHKQLWVPIKVGLNLRKVDLEVGINAEDDERPADDIMPDGMLKKIGPVDISARLLRRLKGCANAQNGKLRVHDYGYDWRLDPLFLSRQLCEFITQLRGKALVIAHSLGGLITRHAINQQPHLFRGVIYAGVPTRCVNILGPMRNGDDVLLSSRVLTAQVNFTIRTSYALLPLDGRCFIDKDTRKEYRVDFFDPETWREYNLSPCLSRPLPALRSAPTGLASYMMTVSKALPSLPMAARKRSSIAVDGVTEPSTSAMTSSTTLDGSASSREDGDQSIETTVGTTVTIKHEDAFAYLSRTLARVKQFKQELVFRPELAEVYPPIAAIYGKNTPTVVGARVHGRAGIKRADAYDNLTFGSGDGVVLARAALPPKGYVIAKGGLLSSERGHVSLLGDLDAVGKALLAVQSASRQS